MLRVACNSKDEIPLGTATGLKGGPPRANDDMTHRSGTWVLRCTAIQIPPLPRGGDALWLDQWAMLLRTSIEQYAT